MTFGRFSSERHYVFYAFYECFLRGCQIPFEDGLDDGPSRLRVARRVRQPERQAHCRQGCCASHASVATSVCAKEQRTKALSFLTRTLHLALDQISLSLQSQRLAPTQLARLLDFCKLTMHGLHLHDLQRTPGQMTKGYAGGDTR